MYKKIAMCLLLVLVFVAACEPKTVEKIVYVEREPEKVVIEYYAEYNAYLPLYAPIPGVEEPGDWGRHVEKLYEERCPWVDIVPVTAVYSGGGSEQLSVRLAAGKYPTVYEAFSGRLFSYSSQFVELPKPDVPFVPGMLDACTVGGKLVAYPTESWPKWGIANVTLMKEAGCVIPEGVQWTTDEAYECALKLDGIGIYLFVPYALKQTGQNDAWMWLNAGADMFKDGDHSKCTWDDTDYVARCLEWQKTLPLPGNPANYDLLEARKRFTLGELALGFSSWIPSLHANVEDGKLAEMPEIKALLAPHLPDVEATRITGEATNAAAVFAPAVEGDERLKEEAIKFALWLTGPEPNFGYHWYGWPTARLDGYRGDVPPEVLEAIEAYGTFDPAFNTGKFNEGRAIWAEEMQAFWLDQKTAEEAVSSFATRYEEAIAE